MIKNIYILRQMFHMPSLENRDGGYRSFMVHVHVLQLVIIHMIHLFMSVLDAKRGENEFLYTLGIISVILHAIHT